MCLLLFFFLLGWFCVSKQFMFNLEQWLFQNVNLECKLFQNVHLAQRLFQRFGTKVVPKCQSYTVFIWHNDCSQMFIWHKHYFKLVIWYKNCSKMVNWHKFFQKFSCYSLKYISAKLFSFKNFLDWAKIVLIQTLARQGIKPQKNRLVLAVTV